MQVPQGLRELSEQSEVLCEGLGWVTPMSTISPIQIFKECSCPESYLDVNFGSSLASKLLLCVRICSQ